MDNSALQYSAVAAVAYFIFGAPETYKLVNRLTTMFGMNTANSAGCPNYKGLAIHGLIVGAIIYFLLSQNYIIKASRPMF